MSNVPDEIVAKSLANNEMKPLLLGAAGYQYRSGWLPSAIVAAIRALCAGLHGCGLRDATDAEFLDAIWQFRRNYHAAILGSQTKPAQA